MTSTMTGTPRAPGAAPTPPSRGGAGASRAPTRATGSTSTSATCRRRNSPPTRPGARCASRATRHRSSPTSRTAPTGGRGGAAGGLAPPGAGGDVRVVMLDSRSRRVVEGARLMADEAEWRWLTESVTGDFAHVVIATSVPPLLPRGIHTLEAWTERICGGAWGRGAARLGERLRQAFDLEHWPSFDASFRQLEELLASLAGGERSPRGTPPATVTVISGDVHHSYLTAVDLPRSGKAAVD